MHSSLDFRTSLWYRLDPPTGTAHTISVDWDAAPDKFIGGSLSFTGVDQTDPIDDTSNVGFGATGTSTSATVNVVTENADAWIVDATATHDDITMVAKTGRVERWNINPGGPITGAGSTLDTTGQGTGSYTMDWTLDSAKQWAISAAALKPAAATAPDIVVMKTVTTLEDPFNGTTDPKAIPAATVLYTIRLTNSGSGPADADSVVITEPIPANTALRVIDFDAGNAGPVAFVDGTPASGLTYTFVALGDPGDDVEFSNDGGSTYTYTPVADGNGVDTTVTHIRINPKGVFLSSTTGDPNFEVQFKTIVQ